MLQTSTHSGSANLVDSNGYDIADNLTSISDAAGGTAYATFGETRDAANQVTQELPGGSALSGQAALNAGYDTREQVCYGGPNGGGTCAAPPTGATAYAYDAANEMTQAGTSTLAYNSANELCWTLPTASANTCGSPPTGATAYGFDTRGNRTSAVPSTGSATCDAYDQADRLTAITSGTGSSCTNSTTVGTYTYNADGLRTSKTVGSTTTDFAWNLPVSLPTLLQERVSGGAVTDYIYGPNGTPLEQISGSSVLLYHADQLGSTRVLTDTSGTAKATYSYDAYGNLTSLTGSVANPFLFAGQYKDSESGLYFLRARYYDPASSQFLNRDPADAATRELYSYVADNPMNAIDPSGKCGLWGNDTCLGDAAGAVAGAATTAWNATGGQVVNNIQNFASSSHTLGVCASVSANFIVGGGTAEACGVVRFDGFVPVGFGTTETFGLGPGLGIGITGLLNLQISNAPNLKSLGGPFAYVEASGGALFAGGGSLAEGVGSCGPFSVGSAGLGVGGGFTSQVGADYTFEQTWLGS